MDETVFLAHIAEDGREQTVDEHERGTAELCARFAAQFGAEEHAKLEAMRHDDGKNTQGFQRRLRGGPAVDHSTAGAFECFRVNAVHEAICIAGHHGGLPDVGNRQTDTADDGTFCGRMKKAMNGGIEEPHGMDRPITAPPRPNFYGDRFYESVWIRMLYSCLVDADYLDTESFMSEGRAAREEYDDMAALLAYFEKHIAPWADPQGELNKKRWEILSACIDAGEGQRGIYTLSAPTGSGKTTASLAFALKHAVKHNMQHIIYVIPYTSIIDQNAKVFRKILHDKNVLEHHSGIVFDKDKDFDSADYKSALAAENWDTPVVVTTAVQFFESFYANRSSKCRKLHNITNSVIIFDEAQMMPSENLLPCVAAISTLCAHFNSTAVLCTATQPVVDDYIAKYAPNIAIKEICPEVGQTYEQFKRVKFEQAGELDDEALAAQLSGHEQVLCIVNSRKAAQAVFDKLPEEGRFHLSTLMYPEHRQKTIEIIRQRLADGEVCRVVSTSLIEAGVDIDFPTVYREMAGLDSILQAAGRCNREGKRNREESIVTVFTSEHRAPRMLGTNIAAANSAMRGEEDIGSPDVVRKYFNTYRAYLGDGTDKARVVEAFEKDTVYCSKMPFKKVAEKFSIIDQNTRTVYIPLGKGVESIARLRCGEKSRKLFREAGRYGVTIYENQFKTLYYSGCIEMIDDENAVLINTGIYDEKMGLKIEESSDINFII